MSKPKKTKSNLQNRRLLINHSKGITVEQLEVTQEVVLLEINKLNDLLRGEKNKGINTLLVFHQKKNTRVQK